MSFIQKCFSRNPKIDSKIMANSKLVFLLFTFLIYLPISTANAADTTKEVTEVSDKPALELVYLAQVNSYYSVNGFYNFSANQGYQKDLDTINDSTDTLDSLISNIDTKVDDNIKTTVYKDTAALWKSYQKVLKQNIREVKKTGYPDLRLAGDMATQNIRLNTALQKLYDALLETTTPKPNKITELSRKAGTTLALMMTKYSARTTSTVSQVYGDGDVDTEITIDVLAKEFDQELKELVTLSKGNKTALKLLDSAATKWDFIESSYINYNQNRVNFIVNLYSKKIISDIDKALSSS